jgi:Fanconi anemia group D2 protein
MDKLISAELDDLPVVIKFLLQTVEPENVGEVIETIRQKLDFRSINKLQKSSRIKTKKIAINQTPEVLILGTLAMSSHKNARIASEYMEAQLLITQPDCLILYMIDALKTGIRFQKFVMDAWFKALAAISKAVSYP